MEFPVNPSQMVDILRTWFFAKDRSIVLADDTFIEGEDISTPGTPVVNRGRLYWKDKCWTQLDEDGVESTLCNGIWQDWTPVITQSATVTATVNYARHLVLDQLVILRVSLTVTGSGMAGNNIQVSLPFNCANNDVVDGIGVGQIFESGVAIYRAILVPQTNHVLFRNTNSTSTNYIGGADPSFALGSPDRIGFTAVYERS